MTTITTQHILAMFTAIADAIETEKDRLSELDGVIGDGDHGVTMDIGFSAVRRALAALDAQSTEPSAVFDAAAKSFLNAVGASSGPLYATAFMRASAAVKGKANLDDRAMAEAFIAMARGVQDRGKAERGDKTMIDAWLPAVDALEGAMQKGDNIHAALGAAANAAEQGAEATKTMLASKGRASRLGDRSLGHIDPGAASAAMIVRAIAQSLHSKGGRRDGAIEL